MWKIFRALFGWDYVGWRNSADSGVARIYRDGLGNPYYFRYRITRVIDRVTSDSQVVWLTCHPSKYLVPHAAPGGTAKDQEGET